MDNPIAQVSKNDTLNNNSNSNINGDGRNFSKNNKNSSSSSSATAGTNSNGKKKNSNGLVKAFLCCFIGDNSKKSSSSSSGNHSGSSANGTSSGATRQELLTNVNNNYASGAGMEALLPPPHAKHLNKKTLVLDLDETLVHSSFKPVANPDFVVPVEIEGIIHQVFVVKRPHVDEFLRAVGEHFEIVVFTASLAKYADPVLNLLDKYQVVHWRLFRESCHNHKGNYVKDLSRIGRDLKSTIIIDNSPTSYMFHPENAIPVDSWFDDEKDRELLELIPLLEDITKVDDVRPVLDSTRKT
ncbi:dullard-like phosphatase domain containing protein [Cavenderia fasciculata]|uniref:protein-serine/threonine phosphatase n=1 Tax=Cavenderia fasciculata TaxID=261658 RepID=F4Q6P2_CACFS|nr:dullard-like phosphatase domain containing protein [Cavenderia fasciculata]EGG16552.1 dullard-like phosphatase domain containing protein [Cavenderia fasciculata]|eukprot:XP_004354952.1 dullard-like phosphatase domain containing protein [Cavenderia fasciculata]